MNTGKLAVDWTILGYLLHPRVAQFIDLFLPKGISQTQSVLFIASNMILYSCYWLEWRTAFMENGIQLYTGASN